MKRKITPKRPKELGHPKSPLLNNKQYEKPSVFTPEGLLREARRQRDTLKKTVPEVCVLDPDGDYVRFMRKTGKVRRNPNWVCYHTDLFEASSNRRPLGLVGGAVGASFAVLVAEELFASGCRVLISLTSAGQIASGRQPPYLIAINRALRDEGTSHHYLAPAPYVWASDVATALMENAFRGAGISVERGGVWTTDAPFRETAEAIAFSKAEGLLAVEMEAAALYAFAEARKKSVVCLAYVTNQLGTTEKDFEKGHDLGARLFQRAVEALVSHWMATQAMAGGSAPKRGTP